MRFTRTDFAAILNTLIDKMTVHYVAPNGDPKEVIATKTGNQWLLNETPTGISLVV
jgi:hypothetical protein